MKANNEATTRPQASRRRFLIFTGAVSAVGAGSLAAAAMPLPAPVAIPKCSLEASLALASPAMREAMVELNAAHSALLTAKARFAADDLKAAAWRDANPEPQGKRAHKRWFRKWEEMREATVRDSWDAQLAAEDKFQDARIAVANVTPRDHHDIITKAAASMAFDALPISDYPRAAIIGYAVATDLAKSAMV